MAEAGDQPLHAPDLLHLLRILPPDVVKYEFMRTLNTRSRTVLRLVCKDLRAIVDDTISCMWADYLRDQHKDFFTPKESRLQPQRQQLPRHGAHNTSSSSGQAFTGPGPRRSVHGPAHAGHGNMGHAAGSTSSMDVPLCSPRLSSLRTMRVGAFQALLAAGVGTVLACSALCCAVHLICMAYVCELPSVCRLPHAMADYIHSSLPCAHAAGDPVRAPPPGLHGLPGVFSSGCSTLTCTSAPPPLHIHAHPSAALPLFPFLPPSCS